MEERSVERPADLRCYLACPTRKAQTLSTTRGRSLEQVRARLLSKRWATSAALHSSATLLLSLAPKVPGWNSTMAQRVAPVSLLRAPPLPVQRPVRSMCTAAMVTPLSLATGATEAAPREA